MARRVAYKVAGDEPLYRSYLANSLRADFERHTPVAQRLITETTGLGADAGDPTARVIDRAGWINANLASFRRLMSPVIEAAARRATSGASEDERDGERADAGAGGRAGGRADDAEKRERADGAVSRKLDDLAVRVASKVGAFELGVVLGWMSRRVLGQYDMLLAAEDPDSPSPDGQAGNGQAGNGHVSNGQVSNGQASTSSAADQAEPQPVGSGDVVYYVGPNILSTEKRHAFPPSEFRLWLALHELTHRSQFTGVPWLRQHFLGLVNGLIDVADPDPERVRNGIKRFFAERREGRDPVADGGLPALFATPEQRKLIEQVGGLMSLVEGHGDVTMARAAVGHVPHAEHFHSVMHHRRSSATGLSRITQKLLGIEAKLAQYSAGEQFIAAIERERGLRAVDQIWESPDFLPSLAEIRDPAVWLERVPTSAHA